MGYYYSLPLYYYLFIFITVCMYIHPGSQVACVANGTTYIPIHCYHAIQDVEEHKFSRQKAPRKNASKPFGMYAWIHNDEVLSVCFSPDGSMLATGDKKTTIYDLKSKTKIHEWDHKDWVFSVGFSPDGSMLATGDYANKTTIYDLKSKTNTRWDHNESVYSVCFLPTALCLQRVINKQNNDIRSQKQDKDTRVGRLKAGGEERDTRCREAFEGGDDWFKRGDDWFKRGDGQSYWWFRRSY